MIVIHLALNENGSWSIDDRDFAMVEHWEKRTGGKLLPGRGVEMAMPGDGGMADVEDEVMNVLPEQPRAVVKKDLSAGKERGAPLRARADALLQDLGLPRTKPNAAVVVEAMEALVADYEQMILDLNNSSETARDKAGAWDKLVSMILTKGQ